MYLVNEEHIETPAKTNDHLATVWIILKKDPELTLPQRIVRTIHTNFDDVQMYLAALHVNNPNERFTYSEIQFSLES